MTFALVLVSLYLVLSLPPLRRRVGALAARRDRAAVAAGLFFVLGGALHFAMPEMYDRMIPPFAPGSPRLWTNLSGALEIAGGLGMLVRPLRPLAAAGLFLLLLAILPANVHVAVASGEIENLPYPPAYFWARVPFQAFYLAWVAWAGDLRGAGRGLRARRAPGPRVRRALRAREAAERDIRPSFDGT
jgi:uncharacterized membrane protein